MGERGKSYTGEALQCKRRQVVYREDYCAYSEIHCDRASFLLCRLLKKSEKRILRGLKRMRENFAVPTGLGLISHYTQR